MLGWRLIRVCPSLTSSVRPWRSFRHLGPWMRCIGGHKWCGAIATLAQVCGAQACRTPTSHTASSCSSIVGPTCHKSLSYIHADPLEEAVFQSLKELFGVSEDEGCGVVQALLLAKATPSAAVNSLQVLSRHAIPPHQLIRAPWVVTQPADSLEKKFHLLKKSHLFTSPSDGLGLCYFPLAKILNFQKFFEKEAKRFPDHPNRIYYLAEKLKVPVAPLTEKVIKCHKVIFMSIDHLEKMINLCHEFELVPEEVLSDLWVLSYGENRSRSRLQQAMELGCHPLKPWMCRCSDRIFNRYLERHQCSKRLLGEHESTIGYLSERLGCPQEELRDRFASNIVLTKVHVIKYERIIDRLLEEGLTREDIRSCMRIFHYSEKRTLGRVRELKQVGLFPFPLKLLLLTPDRFRRFMKEYRRSIASSLPRKSTTGNAVDAG